MVPAMLYEYAPQLDLDMEDLGLLGAIFYAYTCRSKPLFATGIEMGQVLQACPAITKTKLARRIAKWEQAGLVVVEGSAHAEFTARILRLEPLFGRMNRMIVRDHPGFRAETKQSNQQSLFTDYERRIGDLEMALNEEKTKKPKSAPETRNAAETRNIPEPRAASAARTNDNKKIGEFIAKKTGNLTSMRMDNEIRRWTNDLGLKAEFVLCMLELCFERGITHPKEITRIAAGLNECSINNLEAMETYFKNFVDEKKSPMLAAFDPEVISFGQFIGVDMNAEARKKVYYRWRYDWGFSPEMIQKAGEIMCSRTKSGGLEYIDGILNNWREKGLQTTAEADKEMQSHRRTRENNGRRGADKRTTEEEPQVYIPQLVTAGKTTE